MGKMRDYYRVRTGRLPEIDQRLLVVRGSRYCAKEIQELLIGPPPQSEDLPDAPSSAPGAGRFLNQQNLTADFTAILNPCGPDHEAYEFDKNAIEVLVKGKRVGYIQKRSAPEVRRIIAPYVARGVPVELPCTVFWNGDQDSDFRFYTVQLFA